MSATRDKTQKFTFVYSNLYQIYKKGQETDQTRGLATARVLKAEDAAAASAVRIQDYKPVNMIGKRVNAAPKPEVVLQQQHQTVSDLRENLKALNDLHSRLRVMLRELEDLVKE